MLQLFLTFGLVEQKNNSCCKMHSDHDSLITSSLFRAFISFVTNTLMMSIVQTLASILVCDNKLNTLQIDPSVTCWTGFHRSAAVLSMCDPVAFHVLFHCFTCSPFTDSPGSFSPFLCLPVGFSGECFLVFPPLFALVLCWKFVAVALLGVC